MKNLKKIGAMILALTLVFSLGVPAFADSAIGNDGIAYNADNTVTIKNVLKAYNPEEIDIYAPNVRYEFSIEAAAGGATVTDGSNVQAVVKDGVGAPEIVDNGVIEYVSETIEISVSPSGSDNINLVSINFDGIEFPSAGIFRYKVSRAVSGDEVNVIKDSIGDERNLDVYVKEENNVRSIYAFVLHSVSESAASEVKSEGFEDSYYTSNLTVSKTLVNDSFNNNHQFPFTVTFVGAENYHFKTENTAKASVAAMGDGESVSSPAIANGNSVTYIGIPGGVSATVVERNDVFGTSYISSGTADKTNAEEKLIGWTEGSDSSNAAETADTVNNGSENKEVAFTNTLAQISPTGVVMRIAPYALMLGMGMILFLVSRKRKAACEAI